MLHKEKLVTTEEELSPDTKRSSAPSISGTYEAGTYSGDNEYDLQPYESDEPTPVKLACLICKARTFVVKDSATRYSKSRCTWCTDGTMNGEQVNRYLSREKILDKELKQFIENDELYDNHQKVSATKSKP